MTAFYLDLESGNDANDGTTFANRWKTLTSGATAARIAPGDTIRVMASPDETLVGDATWTLNSKTVTLAGAVTANISTCESGWTGSVNVTASLDSAKYKEGSNSVKLVIAAGFTTGLVAYFATGTLDLSGYQQVSFLINNTVAIAASTLSLRLCSDTAGVTTVHTIAIPAIPHANSQPWTPVVVDLGSNMNSAIQSVALYADLDPGTQTIQLDNIIACKASSSADALTHASLIGKVWNRVWVASTTYAANTIRKPTQANRNGFRYKVTAGGGGASGSSEPTWPLEIGLTVADGALTWTCEDLEDTWYALKSINGTTLSLDNDTITIGSGGRGYAGPTETVATYKRECLKQTIVSTATTSTVNVVQDSGTDGSPITYSGGWDRTNMSTLTGETWLTGQNGYGCAVSLASKNFVSIKNINAVKMTSGLISSGSTIYVDHCHFNNCSTGVDLTASGGFAYLTGVICNQISNSNGAINARTGNVIRGFCVTTNSCTSIGFTSGYGACVINNMRVKNNASNSISAGGALYTAGRPVFRNLIESSNGGTATSFGSMSFDNLLTDNPTAFATQASAGLESYIYSTNHNQTANNHVIVADAGVIVSATDQRHTASGISWKFQPTATTRNSAYPMRMPVAKIACAANVAVTVKIWTRRDSTNIKGQLSVAGGQLAGVLETTVACTPSINTWTESSALTFTPTVAGVVEIAFDVWDGVGTTAAFWIDDVSIA
ncbi:hypothetical protein J7E62_27795 [Variovorax paradoxus]|nr:hypothetical protein [Variovorax paradoxus]